MMSSLANSKVGVGIREDAKGTWHPGHPLLFRDQTSGLSERWCRWQNNINPKILDKEETVDISEITGVVASYLKVI
jgi:hypothetical protein